MLSDADIKQRFIEVMSLISEREKVSQNKLCDMIGINKSYYSQIKSATGKVSIRPEILATICAVYNVSPDWILLGKGDPFQITEEELRPKIAKMLDLQENLIGEMLEAILELKAKSPNVVAGLIKKAKHNTQ